MRALVSKGKTVNKTNACQVMPTCQVYSKKVGYYDMQLIDCVIYEFTYVEILNDLFLPNPKSLGAFYSHVSTHNMCQHTMNIICMCMYMNTHIRAHTHCVHVQMKIHIVLWYQIILLMGNLTVK